MPLLIQFSVLSDLGAIKYINMRIIKHNFKAISNRKLKILGSQYRHLALMIGRDRYTSHNESSENS